jgi:alpha-glucosidase
MAAPIYQPGRTHRHVYLPAERWYDWWTDAAIDGPAHLLADAPLERMPLYIRAGAIVPSGPELRYTAERSLDPLTLDLFPGDGSFTLYEDDGTSFSYAEGLFCTTSYQLRAAADRLSFTIGERAGAYIPPRRRLFLNIHAIGGRAAAQHPGAEYDAGRRLLTLQLEDDGRARQLDFALEAD